jgi:hypothetical protein
MHADIFKTIDEYDGYFKTKSLEELQEISFSLDKYQSPERYRLVVNRLSELRLQVVAASFVKEKPIKLSSPLKPAKTFTPPTFSLPDISKMSFTARFIILWILGTFFSFMIVFCAATSGPVSSLDGSGDGCGPERARDFMVFLIHHPIEKTETMLIMGFVLAAIFELFKKKDDHPL